MWPDFEHRPQQETMAHAIAEALGTRSHLIVEAPTGVGKTLAYLIPAVLHARADGRKAIISTHTKNLQEQLYCKDVPLVRHLLGMDFKAVMLKGRRNYLCMTRLHNVLSSTASLFNAQGESELQRISAWSGKTADGDVENLGFTPRPEIWDLVCSEPGICSPKSLRIGLLFPAGARGSPRSRSGDHEPRVVLYAHGPAGCRGPVCFRE